MKHQILICMALFSFVNSWAQSVDTISGLKAPMKLQNPFTKIRITASGGVAYRLGRPPDNSSSSFHYYVQGLRFGPQFNTDISYFFKPGTGLGLKYYEVYSASSTSTSDILSNIKISFIGPIFYKRIQSLNGRNYFNLGTSLGYFQYKDRGWINHVPSFIKGETLGLMIDLAYDLCLIKGLYLGMNGGGYAGAISQMSFNGRMQNLPAKNRENLTSVYFGLGLRYIH